VTTGLLALRGVNRAIVAPDGNPRQRHRSHVITPYIGALSTVEQRAALDRFHRYAPHEPIVWRRSGRGLYWVTLKFDSLEHEILKLARRRERGLRQSIATIARWTGSTADLVSRVLRSLASRGIGTLAVERGRYARATFRIVARSIPQPNRHRAAALTDQPGAFVPTGPMIDGNRPIPPIERDAEGVHDRDFVAILEDMLRRRDADGS
jgi:hypothetical protein